MFRRLLAWFDRLALWDARRREHNHRLRLRGKRVAYTWPRPPRPSDSLGNPHPSTRRNGPESVP